MNRRGRAGQVVNLIHFEVEWKGDVVADDLEAGIAQQVRDVALGTGVEVVAANNVAAILEQTFA
jgi:hypothetical protein